MKNMKNILVAAALLFTLSSAPTFAEETGDASSARVNNEQSTQGNGATWYPVIPGQAYEWLTSLLKR